MSASASHASYWEIVRAQFRKNRGAVVASWLMAALFLLGTYAPLLAHSTPFWTNAPDAPASPWLASLLDPSVFPLDVDHIISNRR